MAGIDKAKGWFPYCLKCCTFYGEKPVLLHKAWIDSKISYGFLSTFGQPLRPLGYVDQLLSSVNAFQSRYT